MTAPPGSRLFYYGTNDEVRLGDRIEVLGWFGRVKYRAHVSYLPGISPRHPELEYGDVQQWAITADDGTTYAIGYDPEQLQPSKDIRLMSRGTGHEPKPDDVLT